MIRSRSWVIITKTSMTQHVKLDQGHNYVTHYQFRVGVWRHNQVNVMTHVGLWLCQGRNRVKLMSHNHEDDADEAGYGHGQCRKMFSKIFNILRLTGRHNSAMITDCRKFTTKITLYGISSFHFYPWPVHSVQETSQNYNYGRHGLTTRQIMLTSLSRRQPITINYWVTWH